MAQASKLKIKEELLVDLTLHDFSAYLLEEFAIKIVKPYYSGSMNAAIKSLMEKAIVDESIALKAIREK